MSWKARPSPAAQESKPAAVENAGPEASSGKPRKRRGTAQAHLAAEHARRHFAHARKLAGAARQHDAIAGGASQTGLSSRSLICSKVSSIRGRMMFTTMLRGTFAS